jgi:CMP/dCMP kinase
MLRPDPDGRGSMIVAIDGQAGSGKSTLGIRLARELGMLYIDTGAMYRAAGLHFLRRTLPPESGLEQAVSEMGLECKAGLDGFRVFLDGEEVTELLRDRAVGQMASRVAVLAPVRRRLTEMTRRFADLGDLVVDGRDIGTVVFPGADVKVFLTASPEVRALRRHEDSAGGRAANLGETLRELEQRDRNDSSRSLAPMTAAPDAVVLDTTGLSLDDAYSSLRALVLAKRERRPHP